MSWIDLHCDTLELFADRARPGSLLANEAGVDFQKMKAGGVTAQFFAMWLPEPEFWAARGLAGMPDPDYVELVAGHFRRELREHADLVAFAGNAADLAANEAAGRMSAFLTIENSRILEGDLRRVDWCYEQGVRLMTLTWNSPNCLGASHSTDRGQMARGLTAFGREAVARMAELGIAVDVSHGSDGVFWDVADIVRGPFLASHSNARALTPHSRNLTDEMIRTIAERGGVIGLNFAPQFLNADMAMDVSRIERMCAHAAYLKNKGGAECLALGSDLDGIVGHLEVPTSAHLPQLRDALKRAGFTEEELDKLSEHNARRFIRDVIR